MNRRLTLIALLAAFLSGCAGSGSGGSSSPALGWCCDTRQMKVCDVGEQGLPLGTGCRCGSQAGTVIRCN